MSFLQKLQKWGITARPATETEIAQLDDAVQAAESATQEPYAYQEYGPGFTEKRPAKIEAPAKQGLFGRLKDRFSAPKIEARDQIIDMVPTVEKPSLAQKLSERLSETSSAVSNRLSSAREAVSSAFQKPDVLNLTKSMMVEPPPSLWDRVKGTGRALKDNVKTMGQPWKDGIKAAGPSFSEGVKSASQNLNEGAKSFGRSLSQRINAVGQSLKNPETRKQVAAELGLNMAVMGGAKIAAGAVMVGTATPVLATFAGMTATTALVGGLLKSRRQYMQASQEGERNFKGFASHVWENRKQFTKNMAGSALVGALGSVAGGLIGEAWNHLHSAAPVAVPDTHDIVQNVSDVPVAPEVPVYHAPAELDEAIKIVREHSFLSEHTIALAQQGDASAIKDIAHAINTDGIRADDHLVRPLLAEAARQADMSAIKDVAPVTTAAPAPAPAVAPVAPNPQFLDDVVSTLGDAAATVTVDTAKDAAIVAGGTAATTAAVVTAANALPALALATAPIQQDAVQLREQARVEQVLQMRAQGISLLQNNFIGLEKGMCYISNTTSREGACSALESEMQEGDFIRVVGKETGLSTAAYVSAPVGEKVETNRFMSSLISVKDTFNTLMQIVNPASIPVAANENEAATPVAVSETAPVAIEVQAQPQTQELPPVAQSAPAAAPDQTQSVKDVFASETAQTAPKDETAAFDEMMKYAPAPPADFEMPPVAQTTAPVAPADAPVAQNVRDAFSKWSIQLPQGISSNNIPSGNPLTPPARQTSPAFSEAFKDLNPVNDDVLARTRQIAAPLPR